MPKVKSRGRASRASAVGAPKRASPRESVCASSAATQGFPAPPSRRRGARAGAGENHVVTSQEPPSTATVQPSPQEALLSLQLIETLVNKEADEVSRRLSPAENPSSLVPTLPSGLNEVPSNAAGIKSSSTVATDLIASRVVQGSLADVSAAVTGLVPSTSERPPPVPGQCFQSVSLPVDARVSEKHFWLQKALAWTIIQS